jgi:hypothetical protein
LSTIKLLAVVIMSEIDPLFFDPEFRKIMEEYGYTGSGEKLLKYLQKLKEKPKEKPKK